jgi:hypothetical protein
MACGNGYRCGRDRALGVVLGSGALHFFSRVCGCGCGFGDCGSGVGQLIGDVVEVEWEGEIWWYVVDGWIDLHFLRDRD